MRIRRIRPRNAMLAVATLAMATALTGALAYAAMGPAQKGVYEKYSVAAKASNASFAGFSAEKGQAFFQGKHQGGKPDSPSCTSCHTTNVKATGKSRAGKEIAPMAASVNPKRFTDYADVEKWFGRNCPDVLGRECTVTEKGDVLAYLLSQ
jgi:hypothetical protein